MTTPMDWDALYAEAELAYGSAPNDFLVQVADRIPPGPVLCLAEGQGRNAVFLASRGHPVTAVDQSAIGLARARDLAAAAGATIETVVADLADFRIEPGTWSGIVAIFAHLPPLLRRRIHQAAVEGLRPGGCFVLEAYAPAQLALGTGGPKAPELLMTRADLVAELRGLDFLVARELERDLHEGRYHVGKSAVVQILAQHPAPTRGRPSGSTRHFDFAGFKAAFERMDTETWLDFYATDAEWVEYTAKHPPRSPRRMAGREVIARFLDRVRTANVVLRIEDEVIGRDRIAFRAWVSLPDGRRIVEHVMLTIRAGRIVRQVDVEISD
ncbi:MAG: methyltransferase domain-containing protein [Gemmatimonadales bacterium]|nr:methyltransferase domain-containing protein [Gemmatimonadales bacterium]